MLYIMRACLLYELPNVEADSVAALNLNVQVKLYEYNADNSGWSIVKHLGGHKKDGPEFAEKKQVSFITFCCVLLPRAVIEKVGYLDETLFMYCEDVDYCIRLAQAGVPMWFLPDAVIHHKAGGSAGGMLSVYYITRNTLYLTCKGKSAAYAKLKTILPLLTGAARYALTKLLGRKKGRSYGAFRGAVDFWNGKMGRMER